MNQGELLVNNFKDEKVLEETIAEYELLIDSKDRDYVTYPNPFHYRVFFGAPGNVSYTKKVLIDPTKPHLGFKYEQVTEQTHYKPIITQKFTNVKYVKLNKVIMPIRYQNILAGGTYVIDTTKDLQDKRYITLHFQELNSLRRYATDSILQTAFGVIFDYRPVNAKYWLGFATDAYVKFDYHDLANIHCLTIDFKDENQKTITVNNLDPTLTDTNDVRHPLYDDYQHIISLKIGVMHTSHNTRNYERTGY